MMVLVNEKTKPSQDRKMELTIMETKVLQSLIISSSGNGHDFGFIEDAQQVLGRKQNESKQIRFTKAVASLEKKGLIEIHEQVDTGNGFKWTQFTFPFDAQGLNPDPSYAISLIVGKL